MSSAVALSTPSTPKAATGASPPPTDWRASGTPSSPKVTWQMAPRLGWQETKDYATGWAQGAAHGAGHAVAGLWQLASSPIESVRPWVTAPLKKFQKYSQADQDTTRVAIALARAGQFQRAGHQMGDQMGSAVASQVLSAAGQAVVGKVVQELSALRPTQAVLQRPLQRLSEIQAHREALRLERIDHGHSLDRHGPQLTAADHTRRVTQGIAADNVYSPTAVSTQFHTASDWLCTREKAIRYAEAQYGITQGQAPNLSRGQPSSYEVILEFRRSRATAHSAQPPYWTNQEHAIPSAEHLRRHPHQNHTPVGCPPKPLGRSTTYALRQGLG
jgi:hypothetical protein